MANQYGIDVAGVEGKVSALKTAKLNREIRENALKTQKEDRTNRLAQATREKQNVMGMASKTPGMEGFNVQTTADFDMVNRFIKNASAEQKNKALAKVETLGKYSMAILNSDDPQQKLAMWEDLKNRMPPNEKGDMPDTLDEGWLTRKATEAKPISDLIKEDIAKRKVKASQEKVKSEFIGKTRLEKLKAVDSKNLEKLKTNEKIKYDKTKTKKERKLKLQKLFELRNSIRKTDPNNPDLKAINKAIKLETEGKQSEIDKLIAMQFGVKPESKKAEKEESSGEVSDSSSFAKKWGF